MSILDKIIGTHSERELRRIRSTVDSIEAMQPQMQALSDDELKDQGINRNTIRLSIGTEHIDDIIADLENGFAAIK